MSRPGLRPSTAAPATTADPSASTPASATATAAAAAAAAADTRGWRPFGLSFAAAVLAALGLWAAVPPPGTAPTVSGPLWGALAAVMVLAAITVREWARRDDPPWAAGACAGLAGLWVLYFWQLGVTLFDVPRVLLPSPAWIGQMLLERRATLAADFVQTVLKAVVVGWALGSLSGFAVGLAIDRLPWLQRGLLPLASLSATVPLVAVAPIMVMWFGFDWPSKAAVVVLMTFFPMLVATLAGLRAAGRLELELMHSYAAGATRTLLWLRLPAALPQLFGALKVNASLALIGAIVAEFFGSPTVGLGFRITTEAARMNMGLVWAAIAVAAVTGSAAYALLVRWERRVAFWHPSVRAATGR